jgi:mannose-6-phosphate isomerase-like protein (cupin superfamily)
VSLRSRVTASLLVFGLIAGSLPMCAQQAESLSREQIRAAIDTLPTKPPTNREVVHAQRYAVKVAMVDHRDGPAELHRSEDRVLYVLAGDGAVCVGGTMQGAHDLSGTEAQASTLEGCRRIAMLPGTVVSIPRGVPYQLQARATKAEFLVVRVEGQ